MRDSCLIILRQGWLGLPLLFVGLVSLAFSQFENESGDKMESSQELIDFINSALTENQKLLGDLRLSRNNINDNELSKLSEEISSLKVRVGFNDVDFSDIESKFSLAKVRFDDRINTMDSRINNSSERLLDSQSIFDDLMQSFGGNIDDAQPSLLALSENLSGGQTELIALGQMLEGVQKDYAYEIASITKQLEDLELRMVPTPPGDIESTSVPEESFSVKDKIYDGLQLDEKLSSSPNRFASSIQPSVNKLNRLESVLGENDQADEVEKLRSQLKNSKSVQSELSMDSVELKSDLRKAYREIVALQTNLKESKRLIEELEKTKESLYKTEDGSPATVNTVSKRIVRLEKELDLAREDLRLSRQNLLMEQKRSMAMIESITGELTRTREQLDDARLALKNNGNDSARMAFLERELSKAKNELKMAQLEPIDPDSNEYVNLQNELESLLQKLPECKLS